MLLKCPFCQRYQVSIQFWWRRLELSKRYCSSWSSTSNLWNHWVRSYINRFYIWRSHRHRQRQLRKPQQQCALKCIVRRLLRHKIVPSYQNLFAEGSPAPIDAHNACGFEKNDHATFRQQKRRPWSIGSGAQWLIWQILANLKIKSLLLCRELFIRDTKYYSWIEPPVNHTQN